MPEGLLLHLDEPPEFGALAFSLDLQPISRQAGKQKKRDLIDAIQGVTRKVKYLLSGDVQIEIEWLVHEKERYETNDSPDIDNILKPIIDALCGPDGLLIDDCQLQAVTSAWIDWTSTDHLLNFNIKFMSDEWVRKEDLVFIHLGDNLYFPMQENMPPQLGAQLLNSVQEMIALKGKLEAQTGDYYAASQMLPIQRLFHRSKLNAFKVMEASTFRKKLGQVSE